LRAAINFLSPAVEGERQAVQTGTEGQETAPTVDQNADTPREDAE